MTRLDEISPEGSMTARRGIEVLALLLPCVVAHAHVHGVATLEIAIEGDKLDMRLTSPLESLLGFEHAPRTEAQRAAMQKMEKELARPEEILVPTLAARCALASSSLDSKMSKEPESPQAPGATGKSPTPDEVHGELEAHYAFRCQRPDALKSMEVRMFERFPRLRRVDVRLVGPRGQKAGRVTPAQRTFGW